jgi:hypothetical protein
VSTEVYEPRRDERLQFKAFRWDGGDDVGLTDYLRQWISPEAWVSLETESDYRRISLPGGAGGNVRTGDMVMPDNSVQGYPGIRVLSYDEFVRRYHRADLAPEIRLEALTAELFRAVRALADKAAELSMQASQLRQERASQ